MTKFWIAKPGPRRPFGEYVNFLWGSVHDCDTDGNAESASSRDWTELTVISRQDESDRVDIDPYAQDPLTLVVRSRRPELAARLAYALVVSCGGVLTSSPTGTGIEPTSLISAMGTFDLGGALERLRTGDQVP